MKQLRPAIVLIVLFTVLTGIALPLGVTGLANIVVPNLAQGSLISRNGTVIGSALIGQNFTSPRYFHPRPSAITGPDPKDSTKTVPTPYDASNSNASNLAPSAKALLDRVRGDVAAVGGKGPVPGDMVTTSASGLDPDISPENAERQIARVASARHLGEDVLHNLVAAHTQSSLFGFIGNPHVNVLELNLALDATPGA
jgi:K+-transporting ATPase ATPase C chain